MMMMMMMMMMRGAQEGRRWMSLHPGRSFEEKSGAQNGKKERKKS